MSVTRGFATTNEKVETPVAILNISKRANQSRHGQVAKTRSYPTLVS